MKTKTSWVCGWVIAGLAAVAAQAGGEMTPAPAPAAGEERAVVAPAMSPVETEVKALMEAITAKLKAGARSEAALAEELKRFDDIVAAYKGKADEECAQVLLLKAMLYLQVLKDLDRGGAEVGRIKAEFAHTQLAQRADEMLAKIAELKAVEAQRSALAAGAVFPDFQEKDMAGRPLSVSGLKGKVVLVDFWATWCGPCVAELPNVTAAYEKYHDKGFEVIGISLDKDEAALKAFLAKNGMPWPQYFDGQGWDNKLGRKYGISSIPATFLLDGEGKIVATDLRGEALSAELAKLLGK